MSATNVAQHVHLVESILSSERGALGAAVLDVTSSQTRILAEFVEPDDWVSSLHASVFAAIRRLIARDALPLEYGSVISELQAMGVLESYSNGYSLICSLGEGVVLSRPMTRRIHELRRLWKQRKEALAK